MNTDIEYKNRNSKIVYYWPILILLVIVALVVAFFPSTPANAGLGKVNVSLLGTSMAGKTGTTVSGIDCLPNVRQFTWSKYAPMCEPKYTRNNGGSTSWGVTKNTIYITYREPNTSGASILAKLFGPAMGTDQQAIATMETYIKFFNSQFELYGRKVVLEPFSGKGDFINELQGQGLEQAKEDAITAKSLHAFADVSLLSSSQFYDQYLADQGVIAIGAIAQPTTWFKAYAPFEYTPTPTCDTGVRALAVGIGRSLANLPAIFAGEPSLQKKIRVFGLIYPENPTYASCGQLLQNLLASQYHVYIKKTIKYSISLADEASEAQSAIAEMKVNGVTSILCGCDPIFPILLTGDATTQNYYPEWLATTFEDVFSQLNDSAEWSHSLTSGLLLPPKDKQEAYRVYKMANPKGTPSPQFAEIYPPLLLLFDALQAAGPDLNPQTFQAGFFRLPRSLPDGNYGRWTFGKDIYSPVSSFNILYWDKNAISTEDGKPGTYVTGNNGKRYTLSIKGVEQLPNHVQLDCFGIKPKTRNKS